MRILVASTAIASLLCPCGVTAAHAQLLACEGAQKPQQVVELMFGRKVPGRSAVTEDEWELFLDHEIIPRFPEGLTVLSGVGQWQDHSSNRIVRESSKIVLIVLPGTDADLARVNEIAETYKKRFKQQSVVVILRPGCVSF